MTTIRRAVFLMATMGSWLAAGLAHGQTHPVEALAWLAGSWHGEANGVSMEEHWTAPRGGTMLGIHRDVKGGVTTGFEFARIEMRDGRPVFLASPAGAPPTAFIAVEAGPARVVFENAAHDYPQRVIYWREGRALRARIEGRQNGRPASDEWTWQAGTLHGPQAPRAGGR